MWTFPVFDDIVARLCSMPSFDSCLRWAFSESSNYIKKWWRLNTSLFFLYDSNTRSYGMVVIFKMKVDVLFTWLCCYSKSNLKNWCAWFSGGSIHSFLFLIRIRVCIYLWSEMFLVLTDRFRQQKLDIDFWYVCVLLIFIWFAWMRIRNAMCYS